MRTLTELDTNCFPAFLAAVEAGNFTGAAKLAHLTQSGVSQHVARLEKELGARLFLRVGKKVLLTDAGRKLADFAERFGDGVDALAAELRKEETLPEGPVRYAMPESCLMTPHFPMLLARRKRHFPGLRLEVTVTTFEEICRAVLEHRVDFGFVTRSARLPGLKLTPYCPEEIVLASADPRHLAFSSARELAQVPFLDHDGAEILFAHWKRHYFPGNRTLHWHDLPRAGGMNRLPGVIRMLEAGVGATVISRHCIAREIASGKALVYREGVVNQIYLAWLKDSHLPRRVTLVVDEFFRMAREEN